MSLPPGPLNGAPIGGNQGSGTGGGAPPAVIQAGPNTIPQNPATVQGWEGSNLAGVNAVESRTVAGGSANAPVINSFAFADPDPGVQAEVILVDMNTTAVNGVFMLIFRDAAGNEAVATGQVVGA